MPASYAGAGELDPDHMADQLQSMIPEHHRQWLDKVLSEYGVPPLGEEDERPEGLLGWVHEKGDRKSTRLNSSHVEISYAVFCLKKKKNSKIHTEPTTLALQNI